MVNFYHQVMNPQIISFKDGITLKGNNTSLNGLRIKTSKDSSLNGNLTALLYSDNYTTNDNIIPTNIKIHLDIYL